MSIYAWLNDKDVSLIACSKPVTKASQEVNDLLENGFNGSVRQLPDSKTHKSKILSGIVQMYISLRKWN